MPMLKKREIWTGVKDKGVVTHNTAKAAHGREGRPWWRHMVAWRRGPSRKLWLLMLLMGLLWVAGNSRWWEIEMKPHCKCVWWSRFGKVSCHRVLEVTPWPHFLRNRHEGRKIRHTLWGHLTNKMHTWNVHCCASFPHIHSFLRDYQKLWKTVDDCI